MLKNNLYKITSLSVSDNKLEAIIEINKDNDVFSGHFPGQPVLPGACMLQIVKEVLESALCKTLRLKKAGQIKFLNPVNPEITPVLNLQLLYIQDVSSINISASFWYKDTAYFKLKGGVFL